MIKLIAMLLAYRWAAREARILKSLDAFKSMYVWMYDTLTGPVLKDSNALNEIAAQVQSWLDYQEDQYRKGGVPLSDDTHLMAPPYWPSRGTLKAWVKALRKEKGE